MENKWICSQLPEEPPKKLLPWAMKNLKEEFDKDFTIIKAERVRLTPGLEQLMENRIEGKSIWAESCTCTACQEEYLCKKVPGLDAFYIAQGEDGITYTTDPEDPLEDPEAFFVEVAENDQITCPYCGATTTIIHARRLAGGRRRQIQVATLNRIHKYTAVMYWLVYADIYGCGVTYGVAPRYAYVLGERGGIHAFTHRRPGVFGKDVAWKEWQTMKTSNERWDNRYDDWGSINNTKIGTYLYPEEIPDLEGTTGEKTGLMAYWKGKEPYPVSYLKLWRKWKPVENLCNLGFTSLVANAIYNGYNAPLEKLSEYVDLSKSKPHEMFGMDRAEFRIMRGWKLKPKAEEWALWQQYQKAGGKEKVLSFMEMIRTYSYTATRMGVTIMMEDPGDDLPKLWRYMGKQGMAGTGLSLLRDARRMHRELTGRHDLTGEELWPRHLQTDHDRLAQMVMEKNKKERSKELQEGFDKVLEIYAGLQWTDGNLAMILPKCNGDLIDEGNTLRHCVGAYGPRHAKGKNIIIFVRHHRRPERNYYTLNMDFSGTEPIMVQLHGYGNEHHGDHKQYRHRIPKKVLGFVEDWKITVLTPWWREQIKKGMETA